MKIRKLNKPIQLRGVFYKPEMPGDPELPDVIDARNASLHPLPPYHMRRMLLRLNDLVW